MKKNHFLLLKKCKKNTESAQLWEWQSGQPCTVKPYKCQAVTTERPAGPGAAPSAPAGGGRRRRSSGAVVRLTEIKHTCSTREDGGGYWR